MSSFQAFLYGVAVGLMLPPMLDCLADLDRRVTRLEVAGIAARESSTPKRAEG